MAVDIRSYYLGWWAFTANLHCPHCGERAKREYDGALRRQLSRCINPACSYLTGHSESQLIKKLEEQRKKATKMSTLTATKSEYQALPTGEYLAQVTDIEEEIGTFGPQFKFSFELLAPKAVEGKKKIGWCSQKLTSGTKTSKLWTWTEALFNRKIVVGEDLDTLNLIGRKCVLVIVNTIVDGDEVDKITGMKPYKKQEPFVVGEFEVGEKVDDDFDPFA